MPITLIPSPADTLTKDGRTSLFTLSGHADISTMHIELTNIETQTAIMLVDLSDTTNWKHTNTGHIYVHYIGLEADPDSTFLGVLGVGFLTNVDATNGDFNDMFSIEMAKKSDLIIAAFNFGGFGFECETAHHFGPITANSTLFQTDVNLLGPDGNTSFPSGNGDLVMIIDRSAGQVNVSATVGYETVA